MLVIIQVAIGLILVYSLVSILVTTVNTLIANLLRWRTYHLKAAIEEMITDPELQREFLAHPLINILSNQVQPAVLSRLVNWLRVHLKLSDGQSQTASAGINPVNQIDPQIFGQVLRTLLAEKASVQLYAPILTAIELVTDPAAKARLHSLAVGLQAQGSVDLTRLWEALNTLNLPSNETAALTAVFSALESKKWTGQLSPGGSQVLTVLEGVRQISDSEFNKALMAIVGTANTVDQVQQNLETWFNQRMDQVTDAYKRHLTNITLLIGLVLALVLNVDTVQLARALWTDPDLRNKVVVQAQEVVNQLDQAAIATPEATPEPSVTEMAVPAQAATAEPPATNPVQDVKEAAQSFNDTLSQLTSLNLPIGWEFTTISQTCKGVQADPTDCQSLRNIWLLFPGNNPANWFGLIVVKLLGIVITVIAVAQGAPFWFDLLRKLVRS
jgi:hypothetical protein